VSVTWWEWVSRTRTQRTRMMVRKIVEVGVIDPSLYLGGVASLSWEGKEGREGWRDGEKYEQRIGLFSLRHFFLYRIESDRSLFPFPLSLIPLQRTWKRRSKTLRTP